MRILTHCTVPVFLLLALCPQADAQTASANTFRVFVRGADTGTEEVTLIESPAGWTLRGSGKLTAPIGLAIDYWEARYDRDWKPIELTVNLTENTNKWTVHTSISGTIASSDVTQGGRSQRLTHTVAPDTIVLPNLIFGAYEAMAARLATAIVGSQLQAFIAPQNALPVVVKNVTPETIQLPGRTINARRWTLNLGGPGGVLDMDVWTDGNRLLRLDIPSQMVSVLRSDIAAVSARLVTMGRGNDEQVSVPANGFSLAATLSRPAAAVEAKPERLPAVVLVSGANVPSDRDEFVSGIPIFAQLANALADAGYLVVRYDERAMGQSGGRAEAATYEDFAADARAVVTYLTKRKDVDPKRIAALGYGEGGWISLLLAGQEQKIAALALIAAPAISGMELVLEQQRLMFENSGTTPAAQQGAIEQQKQILLAVTTGKGWETLPPQLRKRVDTPLYRSFLTFDPTKALGRVRQPMLIVQPELDREVPVYHGDQLAQLGRARMRARGTDFINLPGLNHLLARATTGAVAEYGTLAERTVSPAAILEISSWLKKTLPTQPAR